MRGDCGSPQFDPERPHELRHFFKDLKFHFARSQVVDEQEMKQHALWFIDCNTVELWEILPEFADVTASYQKFVDAVYKLYLGSDTERRWSIGDMEKLVGEASRVGISSLTDLGKYHREFIAMTTFLIAKNRISAGIVECVQKGSLFVHVSTRLSTQFEQNLNLRSKPNQEWDQFYWSMYPPPFEARSLCSNQNPNITLASHHQPLLPPHLPHLH